MSIIQSQATQLATQFGLQADSQELLTTLKATAFRVNDGVVSDAQMTALLIVANQYGLNPWTKEIYAFPDKKNGIIPVVGVDGWLRIINGNPAFDGMSFSHSEEISTPSGGKPCPEWMECVIYRKDRTQPIIIREYLDEVYREPFSGEKNGRQFTINGPWQTHTKRMLRHKVMIQCARMAFSFGGIYDEDEAERIRELNPTQNSTQASGVVIDQKAAMVELEQYPDESFKKNLSGWETIISSKKKTAKEIVDTINSKYRLTDDQEMAILALAPVSESSANGEWLASYGSAE